MTPIVSVIIPAYNEAQSIGLVVGDIPRDLVRDILVVNNGSTDQTEENARKAGALVLSEPRSGYGRACLKGLAFCQTLSPPPDIIIFLDGDYSDFPEEMPALIQPILDQKADLVIGSRNRGHAEKGSITPQQIFGNKLATFLLKKLYGVSYSDLGPFRAIRYDRLMNLNMTDKNYGWTIEMQIKAAKQGLLYQEIPVRYRQRIGVSKVSGTLKGTIMAGYKILFTIAKYL